MDIMLTISYSLKIPNDEFFCSETGYVKEEMQEQLNDIDGECCCQKRASDTFSVI